LINAVFAAFQARKFAADPALIMTLRVTAEVGQQSPKEAPPRTVEVGF